MTLILSARQPDRPPGRRRGHGDAHPGRGHPAARGDPGAHAPPGWAAVGPHAGHRRRDGVRKPAQGVQGQRLRLPPPV